MHGSSDIGVLYDDNLLTGGALSGIIFEQTILFGGYL